MDEGLPYHSSPFECMADLEGGKIKFPVGRRNGVLNLSEFEILTESVKLTQKQKDCAWYYWWMGWKQKEIAHKLNMHQVYVSICLKAVKKKYLKFLKNRVECDYFYDF